MPQVKKKLSWFTSFSLFCFQSIYIINPFEENMQAFVDSFLCMSKQRLGREIGWAGAWFAPSGSLFVGWAKQWRFFLGMSCIFLFGLVAEIKLHSKKIRWTQSSRVQIHTLQYWELNNWSKGSFDENPISNPLSVILLDEPSHHHFIQRRHPTSNTQHDSISFEQPAIYSHHEHCLGKRTRQISFHESIPPWWRCKWKRGVVIVVNLLSVNDSVGWDFNVAAGGCSCPMEHDQPDCFATGPFFLAISNSPILHTTRWPPFPLAQSESEGGCRGSRCFFFGDCLSSWIEIDGWFGKWPDFPKHCSTRNYTGSNILRGSADTTENGRFSWFDIIIIGGIVRIISVVVVVVNRDCCVMWWHDPSICD